MRGLIIAAPFALLGLIAAVAGGGKSKGKSMENIKGNRAAFRRAFAVTGLGDDWLRFLEQTAKRESNFSATAHNRSEAEKAASARSAVKNATTLAKAGYLPTQWSFGSKGLFQALGPVAIVGGGGLRFSPEFIRDTYGPDIMFDPGAALAFAMSFATGLTRWDNFAGTWGSLNAGWGWPAKMGDAEYVAKASSKAEARAALLGWQPGWTRERITAIPRYTQSSLQALARAATRAWGAG